MEVGSIISSTNWSCSRPNEACSLFFVEREKNVQMKAYKAACLMTFSCIYIALVSFSITAQTTSNLAPSGNHKQHLISQDKNTTENLVSTRFKQVAQQGFFQKFASFASVV